MGLIKKGGTMGKRRSIVFAILWILVFVTAGGLTGCTTESSQTMISTDESALSIDEDGTYSSKEEVALYIHIYGHLPSNYVTKQEAEEQGWDNREGNLWEVLPGKSIGGDRFGNYEEQLPRGHSYKECDIDFDGGYRNAKRIIYSDDGMIFYTEDHYNTFEQLY